MKHLRLEPLLNESDFWNQITSKIKEFEARKYTIPKRAQNGVFVEYKVKIDQRGHTMDQKGLKIYVKRQKKSFWTKNTCFVAVFA